MKNDTGSLRIARKFPHVLHRSLFVVHGRPNIVSGRRGDRVLYLTVRLSGNHTKVCVWSMAIVELINGGVSLNSLSRCR